MECDLEADSLSDISRKNSKARKFSSADKAARKVLAPFLRRIRRQETQNLTSKVNEKYQKHIIRSKIKDVISKLTSFCKDSLEVPTVLNETSEILKEVTKSVGVSSYIVDESSEYITLNPKYMPRKGRHSVRYKVEPGKTLAAFVAYSQEFVMVDDVLGDPRFPLGIPGCKKTIKSVLCVPVLTTVDGNCIAVIELFRNINQDPYSPLDLEICVSMTGWMGAAIHQNSERLFLLKKSELNNYLTSLVEFFFAEAFSFDKFVSDIIECAKLSVQAQLGSFYVMDEEVREGTDDEIMADVYEEGIDESRYIFKKKTKQRFSRTSTGLAGYVARQGKMLNVSEAYKDPMFNRTMKLHDVLMRSVISIPLKGSLGVLGVLQLVNKLEEPCFTKQDEILLQSIAGYAYLACQHGVLKEKLRKSFYRYAGCEELLKIQFQPCPDDLQLLRCLPLFRKSELPKGFFNFDWIITGKEANAPSYAVFMFFHLLGDQYFDIKKLTAFVLTVKKSYRNNPYHNFAHAFTVFHCMFNVVNRNKECFSNLEILALLVGTICHDSDHVGYTNNFLEMTNHWLAELYWESPLEHHHYYVCLLIVEATGFFSHLSSSETAEINRVLKHLILATDLVQHFRSRNQIMNLVKTKTFDWKNSDHRLMFFGLVMTACDVSGQCKPFYSAKKVTEGLYREFYNQGDVEKNLGLTPLAMMDREKTSSIPENQIQFLSLICIPCVEILVAVFPNTEELYKQCVELKDCWSDIQAKKVVEVWKIDESIWESCSHYPYIRFLQKTGLQIGFFKITWYTTAFNRTLMHLSTIKPKFLQKWFSLGVFATILLVPASLYLLVMSVINVLKKEKSSSNKNLVLEPMVPGLNLPVSDIGYYFVTIAFCSIIHEMGHAIAAFKEGIQISGVGLIVVLLIPVAYVKMNSEQLSVLHPKRQLRIFCAGIWHNIVLSFVAFLILGMIPILLSPFYELGRGVYVMNIKKNSKVSGENGISVGDKLVAINDCEVSDQETWQQCLMSFTNKPSPGYCITEDIIHQLDESIPMTVSESGTVECCGNSSGAHLCFETLEDETPLQILQYSCLPGRPIVAGTAYTCGSPKDCPPGLHCVRPVTSRGTTLLRIQRSRGDVVIYIGVPKHILATVDVSDYVQIFNFFPAKLPEILIRLAKYFVIVSSGLAVMNAVPCFYFDGNHISYSLISYLIQGRFHFKNLLALSCNVFGMLLLVINFLCLTWKFISVNF